MPAESVLAATRPPFPTYLLPSISFPSPFTTWQRRRSSTPSVSSTVSANSVSSATSHISSANTTPSTSPPQPTYFGQKARSGQSNTTAQTIAEQTDAEGQEEARATRLGRIQPDTLKCSSCATDLAFASQIVSKGFTGRHGRAYLVSAPPPSQFSSNRKTNGKESEKHRARDLINTKVGRPVSRQLVTGAHVVADISCKVCNTVVGWKYVDAKEPAQRYKIGKFILETRRLVGGKAWEDVDGTTVDGDAYMMAGEGGRGQGDAGEEEIEFDSDDEDECDDLFAGTWDSEMVRKRRERAFHPRTKTNVGTSF